MEKYVKPGCPQCGTTNWRPTQNKETKKRTEMICRHCPYVGPQPKPVDQEKDTDFE